MSRIWQVYLAGEIHTDWREQIRSGCAELDLPVEFSGPQADHGNSDDCGVRILGEEAEARWKDRKGALINAISNRTSLRDADIVVVRFGSEYRQWNAAFDAGIAAAMDKAMIILHAPDLTHALKEVDAAANAVAETPQQVVAVLRYVTRGEL